MTRPDTPFEAASYDLNKFRERRMAERRATARDTPERRATPTGGGRQDDRQAQEPKGAAGDAGNT